MLARRGFTETRRSERRPADPVLDLTPGAEQDRLIRAMTRAADPDGALLGLVRVLEAAGDDVGELREALREDEQVRDRVIGVLGISTALVDHLVAHPEQWH